MTSQHKSLKERLGPTIAFVAPLVLVIALAGYLRYQQQSQPILLEVEFPTRIGITPGERTLNTEITLRLQNRTREDMDLVVANDCNILRWYLLDNSGSFIQSQFVDDCGDTAVAEIVRAQSTLVRTTTITMDADRLTPGTRYRLMLQFWGYETQVRFRVTEDDPAGD